MGLIVPKLGSAIITMGLGALPTVAIKVQGAGGEPEPRYKLYYIDKKFEIPLSQLNVIVPFKKEVKIEGLDLVKQVETEIQVKALTIAQFEKLTALLSALNIIKPHEQQLALDSTQLNQFIMEKVGEHYLINPTKLRRFIDSVVDEALKDLEETE